MDATAIELSASPPKTDDAPTDARRVILIGFALVVGVVGGFAAWAAMTPLASAVVAPGVVVAESHRREVQHLDGGIVAAVHVREGDRVEAGQRLISLDPTRPRANLEVLQAQEMALLAQAARLRAEQLGAEDIAFPEELLRQAERDPRAAEAIGGQRALFEARREAYLGQVEILRQRIAQLRAQIAGLRLQQAAAARQAELIEEELGGARTLERQGFSPRTRLLALERELARFRSDEAEHLGAAARAEQAIGETELQIVQTRRQIVEEASRQLQETLAQLREARERLIAARDLVERLDILSPIAGRVVGLQVTSAGGVIAPGRTILSIVPEEDELIVEARVPTHQIEGITVGAEGVVHFTALPQRTLPMLKGRVVLVGADALPDEATRMPYYLVRVRVNPDSLASIADRRLLPGMPADVVLHRGERTVLEYLVDPLAPFLLRAFRER